MKQLANRVDRLEAKGGHGLTRAEVRRIENHFWAEVEAWAEAFPATAATMTEAERINTLDPVAHIGWTDRFTGEADLDVVKLYGFWGRPVTPTDFVLVQAYIPGDELEWHGKSQQSRDSGRFIQLSHLNAFPSVAS